MKKNEILLLAFVCLLGVSCSANNEQRDSLPNIVLILVDDLGFGDISCNNPDSKISTPNIDKLASQGVRFIDGHTSAAQCSPTRYGLLTGRYSWRTRLKQGVLTHFDEPLIENDRETIASLLKKKGYSTACVGKWHLGLGWQTIDGETLNPRSWDARQNLIIDYSKPLTISPNDFGFDYYFHGEDHLTVLIPWAPTAFAGSVKIVDRKRVELLDATIGDVSKVLSQWGVGAGGLLGKTAAGAGRLTDSAQ